MDISAKKCSKCGKIKYLTLFHLRSDSADGYRSDCKECHLNSGKQYRRTKNGWLTESYSSQKSCSKKRGHPPPSYSKKELKTWVYSQSKFNVMFIEWEKSNYNKNMSPSIDRLDDEKPYTLSNIQILTWFENSRKQKNDIINGVNTKNCRAVVQMTLDGLFISEFYSLNQIQRETGFLANAIRGVCNGSGRTAYGFYWKYKN